MQGGQDDTHRHFEQLAVAHVLGGLEGEQAQLFRSHLLDCANCRARVGELRAIAYDLADVEREERRTRAGNAVETKQRDVGTQRSAPLQPGSLRTVRVAMTVGLVLLIIMTGWNFMLRQHVERRSVELRELRTAATLLNLGEAAQLQAVAEEIDAEVRYDTEGIVVVANGVVADRLYAIYLSDAGGNLLRGPRTVRADGHRLLELLPRVPGTATVTVTQPDPEAPVPDRPDEGRPILQAVLPGPAPSATTVPELSTAGD